MDVLDNFHTKALTNKPNCRFQRANWLRRAYREVNTWDCWQVRWNLNKNKWPSSIMGWLTLSSRIPLYYFSSIFVANFNCQVKNRWEFVTYQDQDSIIFPLFSCLPLFLFIYFYLFFLKKKIQLKVVFFFKSTCSTYSSCSCRLRSFSIRPIWRKWWQQTSVFFFF